MFSSGSGQTPSRTPRRTAAASSTPRTSASPSISSNTTAAAAVARSRATRATPSRFNDSPTTTAAPATTPRAARAVQLEENDRSGRGDVEVGERVLVRDAAYTVLERGGLPYEPEHLIAAADPYTDPLRASLDSLTGFAFLISREHCLVWNWSRRSSSATTYLFPLPTISRLPALASTFSPLAFAAFVPAPLQPAQREPGLLIVSPTGDLRYWDNVSLALSGVERWKGAQAALEEGELVRGIVMHTSTSFLLSTTHSRLHVVTLLAVGGRMDIAVRPFARTVGWAGSVWSFFGGKGSDPRSGILAVVLGSSSSSSSNEREAVLAYAVAARTVQVWRLPGRDDGGGERLLVEQDVFSGVLEALMGAKPSNEVWALNEAKVEILDAQMGSGGALLLLVSHVPDLDAPSTFAHAIVTLVVGNVQSSVTVVGVRHLSYQSGPDPRPLSTPRLALPGGETAFIVFTDAIVMLSLARGSSFEETFPLRSATNRFIGMSSPLPAPTSIAAPSLPTTLSLLTLSTTIISIEVASSALSKLNLERKESDEARKTRKLKSKIEQAIFFGNESFENPLAFNLLPGFEGDLLSAAEGVSAEILSSTSANQPTIIDLRAQLADRSARARALILYVNSNGLLGKLSQSSRNRLSWDAERLAAAAALWQHHNARLNERQSEDSTLAAAVAAYLFDIGEEASGNDFVRTFFTHKVSSIGPLAEVVTKLAKSSLASSTDLAARSSSLYEANTLILLIFKAAARHRSENGGLYGIDSRTLPNEGWLSRSAILDLLKWHFETTATLLSQRSRDFGNAIEQDTKYGGRGGAAKGERGGAMDQATMQAELQHQIADMAGFVFAMFEERLLFLSTASVDGLPSADHRTVLDQYLNARPRYISTLVSCSQVKTAYELAERHRDFRSLVELSNHVLHGSSSKIDSLMKVYGEEYAFALYSFYVEQGQLQTLMQQDDVYRPLLTKFLDSTDNSRIDWINDITITRFDHATASLVKAASVEKGLPEKKLMLSIAKLNQVAQATHDDIGSESVQRAIELIDDDLDLVNSQQELAITLAQGSFLESRLSIEQQSDMITHRVAPNLSDRPASAQLYSDFTARLLRNEAISAEDTIDLLTLKENNKADEEDYASALDVLVRAKNIPHARHAIALQSIWRRVYLRDDWKSLRSGPSMTDEEIGMNLMATALFSTLQHANAAEISPALYLSPAKSLFSHSRDEVAARFPELSSEYIDGLLSDLHRESDFVKEAIESYGLNEYCDEIKRLLQDGYSARVGHAVAVIDEDSMME